MAWTASAVEAIRVMLDQLANAIDDVSFARKGRAVASEHVEKGAAGHADKT